MVYLLRMPVFKLINFLKETIFSKRSSKPNWGTLDSSFKEIPDWNKIDLNNPANLERIGSQFFSGYKVEKSYEKAVYWLSNDAGWLCLG